MALMTTEQMLSGIRNWVLDKLAPIIALIPAQASSSNQLADKNFVNSSVSTSTATFRGTYNLVSDLMLPVTATQVDIAAALAPIVSGEDKNDYAFVQIPTANDKPTEIARVDRYKYNGSAWGYEFSLNNSGFTAAQWAAINSGITEESWATTPEFEEQDPSETDLVDQYVALLNTLYQAITDAQNAKADYVGEDNYVYHWNGVAGEYQRTGIYVKGDPGVTSYADLTDKPSKLSQFIDDLGSNPVHDHASLVNNGSYNSTTKKIELKHNSTVLATIDATAFVKDGMVSDVDITGGNLVITFNTDSGKQPISIPLVDIFDPSNYYNKEEIDILMSEEGQNVDEKLAHTPEFVEDSTDTFPF